MIRIASIPSRVDNNPYIELFYRSLEPHGMRLVHGLWPNRESVLKYRDTVDVIHIQWCPEQVWRSAGPGFCKQLRGVVGLWRGLQLAKRLGKRIVWTVHDVEFHEGNNCVDHWGYRALARSADLIISHASWGPREILRRYGGKQAQMLVMPIGNYDGVYPAPNPRGPTLARAGLRENRKTLLCFGMLRPYKGFDLAIDAVRQLGEDYQLLIAGNPHVPQWGEELRIRCRDLNNVHLIFKHLQDQEIADLVHAADCVVLPYRSITGSAAILGAITLERGVVASDLPFFRETLALEPNAGVLCLPEDVTALAHGIQEFFKLPVELRNAAARRLADQFSWDKVILPYASWLKQAVPHRQAVSQQEIC